MASAPSESASGMPRGTGRLKDKVAIITGSSSGLGRAIAIRYAREGAKVVCSDLQPSARMDIAGERAIATHEHIIGSGSDAIFVKCDASSAEDMEALVKAAVQQYGRVDVMVNNAGIVPEATKETSLPIHLCAESTFDRAMTVNVKSVFLGCKYAIAQMLEQPPHPSGDRGWIINMSSIYGIVATNRAPGYCASKAAVSNLTRQVALDYSKENIHCNALNPGHVQTAIFADTVALVDREVLENMYPFKGPGKPDDIAKMAVVLASDDASWMTGALVSVDGGFIAR